jgi:hypothetical protein
MQMPTSHCVCDDVSEDSPAYWMTCYITWKWPNPTVYENGCTRVCMSWCALTLLFLLNDFVICITWKWPHSTVYELMCLKTALHTEWLVTCITWKWPHSTVCELMCRKIVLCREWLGTHITWKWPHSTVYELMCFKIDLPPEWLGTCITWKWPQLHRVWVDVPYDCSLYRMTWYMHRMKMAALHGVWVNVAWLLFIQNDLVHVWHENGRTPLCMGWCSLTLCGWITGYPVFSLLNMSDHSRDIPFLEHDKMQQTIAISCASQLQW